MDNITLSVVIPAYNEASRIGCTLESIAQYFNSKDISHEIIVVDDGSDDGTPDIVRAQRVSLPNLCVLENERNRGKGYSVNRGMLAARGKYRLFMDADNSVDISQVDDFIKEIDGKYDVAIGSIRLKKSEVSENSGWHRRVLGYGAKIIIGILAVPGIKDTQRGFKLFSDSAAKAIFPLQTIERFGFDIEILVIAWVNGFKIKELPVVWDNPAGSKVTLKSYFQTLRELIKITWNRAARKYTLISNTAQQKISS